MLVRHLYASRADHEVDDAFVASILERSDVTPARLAEITERRFAGRRMGSVNLNRVNLSIILRFSESPVLDPFSMSGQASRALLDELTSTAAIVSRDGAERPDHPVRKGDEPARRRR